MAHQPANCDVVETWIKDIEKDDANVKWIMANATLCPFCKRACTLLYGCNFVHCNPGCGNTFCIQCGEPWKDADDSGGHASSRHMSCNKFKGGANDKSK